MDNLVDYIRWMEDFPISSTGFLDADALVLCMLSCFDLSPVFAEQEAVPLRDCQRMIDAGEVRVEITGKDMGYREILEAAVRSRRFGELLMTDYVDLLRAQPPLQFSAVCFHDASDLSFLSFRGTDSSLAGWREDFMISFSHTEAQKLAKEYAERVIRPGRRWRMGGHSKGGNLALYAGCTMEDAPFSRIEHIYILDGPGLCPEVIPSDSLDRIAEKACRILPEFSVVGKLFEPKLPHTEIVLSSAPGILQHSLSTWGIDHGQLALSDHHDARSLWVSEVLDRWIANMSREERVVFVNEVFDALGAGGAQTLEELAAEGWEGYEIIKPRFQAASETTRRILADLPKQAVLGSLGLWRGK